MNNEIFLRRKQKIVITDQFNESSDHVNLVHLATLLKNLELLGFTLSLPLLEALKKLSLEQLAYFTNELTKWVKKLLGVHVKYQPMYVNFPKQVMETNSATLYFNAIIHYLTEGKWLPDYKTNQRGRLITPPKLRIIGLGTSEEFEQIFTQLITAKTSLSITDKEDLSWFFGNHPNAIEFLPERIPQKENAALISSLIINKFGLSGQHSIRRYFKTATDVLRLAVALSDGDISLATSCKFINFKRPIRRLLLSLLEQCGDIAEDMKRYKKRWIRLAERLHPREYNCYQQANNIFYKLRNDIVIDTFNSQIASSIRQQNISQALMLLKNRPGELARRLDHLLRMNVSQQSMILAAFKEVVMKVATPVLLQVREHFKKRNTNPSDLRVFFPKGEVAKAYAIINQLPRLKESTCQPLITICEEALIAHYQQRSALGKVYINPDLTHYIVPFSQRSASKALKTIVRGSRLPIAKNTSTLRAFLWWKNGKERTDLDLSAVMLDEQWHYKEHVSFTHLKSANYKAVHSGDIVDAPNGASEFIDLDVNSILAYEARYIVLCVNSYTSQRYCDLPECFAGWMSRQEPDSGEIYEPKTVENKFDLSANTQIAIPFIIDLKEQQVIWADLSLTRYPNWYNTVEGNLKGISLACRAITEMIKPNLYDLIYLNALARGSLCEDKIAADTIFDVNEGITPLDTELFMCDFI